MGSLSVISSNKESFDWSQVWAKGIVDRFSLQAENKDIVIATIVELLGEIQLGNSCLVIEPNTAKLFENLVSNKEEVVAPFFYDGEYLYLHRHFNLELMLAAEVKRLVLAEKHSCDLTEYLSLLTDEFQRKAMQVVSANNISLITGGPGTGKTYTLARIIAALSKQLPNAKIAMAAPTGKAAQRMREALQKAFLDETLIQQGLITEDLANLVPTTLHRLIGMGHSGKPQYSKHRQLPFDILVVDEVSMLDLSLAYNLFSAIKDGAKVILLGDANQLASVDVGYVLADLKASSLLLDSQVNLITSRRFSDDALIGKLAKFIQENHELRSDLGVVKELESKIVAPGSLKKINLSEVAIDAIQMEYKTSEKKLASHYEDLFLGYEGYIKALKDYLKANNPSDENAVQNIVLAFDDYRILTATKNGDLGLMILNRHIKNMLVEKLRISEAGHWYLGRPVMITENNYKLGLSNGDIGITLKHRQNIGEFEVYFPSCQKWVSAKRLPASIQTAFVLTIHKSQGSEFSHVAVIIDESSEKLLSQELIYTAITRAKKVVSLLAEPSALGKAIKTKSIRKSGLLKKM